MYRWGREVQREVSRAAYIMRHALTRISGYRKKKKPRSGDPGLGFTLFRQLPPVAPCRHNKASVFLVGRL